MNQNTSQPFGLSPQDRRLAAGMNGSQKNLPEGILRSLLRSSSFRQGREVRIKKVVGEQVMQMPGDLRSHSEGFDPSGTF
ncbi:hypothetical protein A2858_04180 [Candidatus Daviesbacteria bacterium RIFCSPHIGHO2_01_FULL_36_37]|uniref:Uncharacterized protein n=2 Tax=Candidatus Daviesiibacteriota TaxID=1752718 RepID=A0A1F5K4A5_9BACT|nr:MAG: hypothetical protein A2858_04180 [Candidatus Daviesbacteria bacterium RIFCSPHIGHO2_01_FULL_36_37]OGE35645.1 MAG: hypothetical protein A3E66_04320 [Candidatus Daviesbacteria bacterium RIFCSPHIGHO2_12_FULL_37_16]